MGQLIPCQDAFDLSDLCRKIRASSNFSVAWQFYCVEGFDLSNARDVRRAMDQIIAQPELHEFLKKSFVSRYYDDQFQVNPIHEHCCIQSADSTFENTLAKIAGDHAGAYSQLRPATDKERKAIASLFSGPSSPYFAFQLMPGRESSCTECKSHNNEIFSSWFYGVAWDWCFLVGWPGLNLLWIGCLTDTD